MLLQQTGILIDWNVSILTSFLDVQMVSFCFERRNLLSFECFSGEFPFAHSLKNNIFFFYKFLTVFSSKRVLLVSIRYYYGHLLWNLVQDTCV